MLANTDSNIIGSDAQGVNSKSFSWAMAANGYAAAIYNGSTANYSNGLAVRVAGTGSTEKILDLSVGGSRLSAGTPVMRVMGTGIVNIGSTAGTSMLNVTNGLMIDAGDANTGSISYANVATGNGIVFGASSGEGLASNRANNTTGMNYQGLDFYTNYTNRLCISNGGSVGIGTMSPGNTLTVNGSAAVWNSNKLNFYTNGGSTAQGFIGQYGSNSDMSLASVVSGSWLRVGANGANIAFFPDGTITTGSSPKAVISSTGVGINTTSPAYPLDIRSTPSGNSLSSVSYHYITSSGASGNSSGPAVDISVYADGRVVCGGEIDIASDARIKNVKGTSDHATDLETLDRIAITDYTMKDRLMKGDDKYKKVIAQQVKEVYPQAVKSNTNPVSVPNIYDSARITQAGDHALSFSFAKSIPVSKDIAAGRRIKCYLYESATGAQKEVSGTITALSGTTITVSTVDAISQGGYEHEAFVYGTEVTDFMTVDYDAISMLNVSATQELYRIIRSQQQEIQTLHDKNNAEQSDIDKLKASVETLQQIIGSRAQK